ncbi:hypothetical protein CPB86DRAFT_878639 [Serendipita vermifera]|nr:hypothetical protein CPB86DRAFT_878639 [Serendipita vermifera]
MSEAALVEENQRLSVSSLIWLLGQIELLDSSIETVVKILQHIITEDTGLALARHRLKDDINWEAMFEAITRFLLYTKREMWNHDSTSEREVQLMTLFQMIAAVNEGPTLKGEVWALLAGYPFDQEYEQSTPSGIAARFAAWRHKRPFPRDSTVGWPKDLFNDICELHQNKLHYIVPVLLQEFVRMGGENEEGESQGFIIDCLTMLWKTLDFEDERPLAKEIRSAMLSTTLSVKKIQVATSAPLHTRIINVITAFDVPHDTQPYPPIVQALVLRVLLDLCSFDCNSHLELFKILCHPSLANLWKSELTIESSMMPSSCMHYWPYIKRWYPTNHESKIPWAIELAAAVKNTIDHLPHGLIKGSGEWRTLIMALETLAMCIGARPFSELSSVAPSELSQDRCFEWVLDVLANLSSGMPDEKFGFIVASMLTGSVRNLLRETFYCPEEVTSQGAGYSFITRRERLKKECEDPSLVFAGCALFGWNYEPSRPTAGDHAWYTAPLKGAFAHWDNFEPIIFLKCDKKLFEELGNREEGNEFWDDSMITFLLRRANPDKRLYVENNDSSTQHFQPLKVVKASEVATDIFETSMAAFGNMVSRDSDINDTYRKLSLQVGILKVMMKLSTFDGFGQRFLESGNLKWFNTLQWDIIEEGETAKGLGFNSCTPIGALNHWLQINTNMDNMKALKHDQVGMIINSGILETSQDRGAPDVIKFIIRILNLGRKVRQALLRAEQNKPTPRDICIKLLGEIVNTQKEKIQSDATYWETKGEALFGVASFEEWKGGISLLIEKLGQIWLPVANSSHLVETQ